MKILFLDVDGVLNSTRSRSFLALSKGALRRLRSIVEQTGCKIVVSSTWRKHEFSRVRLRKTLRYKGLEIYDITPDFSRGSIGERGCRGDEIQEWLDRHPETTAYCILDDDSDMLDSQLRNFVQTDMDYGLTDTLAYRAVQILNRGEL